MREAMGYLLAVAVTVAAALYFLHPPSPPAYVASEHCTTLSPKGPLPSVSQEKGTLTLREINRSIPLDDRIETLWIVSVPEEGERSDKKTNTRVAAFVPPEENGTVSETDETGSPDPRSEGNESKKRVPHSPRYGVAFWLQSRAEQEENLSGYEDTDASRLMQRIGATLGDPVFLRLFKAERELEVWVELEGRYEFLERYKLCFLTGGLGPKLDGEDGQFPEGFYQIDLPALSSYLALEIDYPNRYDRYYDRTGGPVPIIGSCNGEEGAGIRLRDMEILHTIVKAALIESHTTVAFHSFPFRMSQEEMRRHIGESWYLFWENLRQGYDLFNRTHHLPQVFVEEGEYRYRLSL